MHKLVLEFAEDAHKVRIREYWSAFNASVGAAAVRFLFLKFQLQGLFGSCPVQRNFAACKVASTPRTKLASFRTSITREFRVTLITSRR